MNPIESVVCAVMPCLIHRFVTNVSDVIGGLEDVRKTKLNNMSPIVTIYHPDILGWLLDVMTYMTCAESSDVLCAACHVTLQLAVVLVQNIIRTREILEDRGVSAETQRRLRVGLEIRVRQQRQQG